MNKWIWSGVIVFCSSIIVAATGWNFLATADIPKNYVTKNEFMYYMKQNEEHFNLFVKRYQENHDKLAIKIDNLTNLLMEHSLERNRNDD